MDEPDGDWSKGALHKCSLSGYQHLPTTPMSGAAELRWFQHQAMRPEIMNQSLIICELSKMPGFGGTLDSRESSSKYVLVTQEELTYNVDQNEALTAPVKAAESTTLREQSWGLCMSETREAGRTSAGSATERTDNCDILFLTDFVMKF